MNWDAIGAIAEGIGALAVVITLVYLATQVKYAKSAAADTNRLMRATGVRDMSLVLAQNDELRRSLIRTFKTDDYYKEFATRFDVDSIDTERVDFVAHYYFWLHWGQYNTTSTEKDLEELRHIIGGLYSLPAINYAWNNSPYGKQEFEEDFVRFVDSIIQSEDA
jgi:hypothetical protein